MLPKRRAATAQTTDYFSAIVENQAVIAFDRDGVITFANAVMAETMGYAAEDLVGRHHRIFVDAAHARTPEYEKFWQTLRSGSPMTGEFQRLTRSGAPVTLGAVYSPIRDRHNRVTGVVKTAAVVTNGVEARQRADQLLRTLDELPIPVMTCNPTTFVIDYMNQASLETLRKIERHLPIKADAVLGSPIDVFHKRPEHQRKMVSAMGSAGVQTTIKVGPEHLELKISTIGGRPVLVWYIVSHRMEMAESIAQSVTAMGRVGDDVTSASDALGRSTAETLTLAGDLDESSRRQATAAADAAARAAGASKQASMVSESARQARGQLSSLVEAVAGVSAVVDTVSQIASKTNLLALNATIEAARAGDFGRGFAVVAAEVKALSDQTARSTEEIGQIIAQIQNRTHETASTVERVISGIGDIDELVRHVADAADVQRGLAGHVATTVTTVAQNATKTRTFADDVAQAARAVQDAASKLSTRVSDFMRKE